MSHTVTQADIDLGEVENFASVSGTPAGGSELTAWAGADATPSTATSNPGAGGGAKVTLSAVQAVPGELDLTHALVDLSRQFVGIFSATYRVTLENIGNGGPHQPRAHQ